MSGNLGAKASELPLITLSYSLYFSFRGRLAYARTAGGRGSGERKLRGESKEGPVGPSLCRFKGIAKGEIEIPLCRFS